MESSSLDLEAQAQRAMAFAEQCFLAGDIAGARRCAQYALHTAPGLPGAEQALVAYDVHAAAAARGGSSTAPDWYAVLGLPRPQRLQLPDVLDAVTRDAIKAQHRRLCLLVHPDKNLSAAADGAFKLVQVAYDALSATPRPAATDRPAWEEELFCFWQTADDDMTPPAAAPKQAPIVRPKPRQAAPPPAPEQILLLPAPRQPPVYRSPPPRPSCPLSPYCLFCRLHTAAGAQEGFSGSGDDEDYCYF
jgi:hypothetical protein